MQGPVAALPVQDGESLLPKKGVQDSHAGSSCAKESADFSLVPGKFELFCRVPIGASTAHLYCSSALLLERINPYFDKTDPAQGLQGAAAPASLASKHAL